MELVSHSGWLRSGILTQDEDQHEHDDAADHDEE